MKKFGVAVIAGAVGTAIGAAGTIVLISAMSVRTVELKKQYLREINNLFYKLEDMYRVETEDSSVIVDDSEELLGLIREVTDLKIRVKSVGLDFAKIMQDEANGITEPEVIWLLRSLPLEVARLKQAYEKIIKKEEEKEA